MNNFGPKSPEHRVSDVNWADNQSSASASGQQQQNDSFSRSASQTSSSPATTFSTNTPASTSNTSPPSDLASLVKTATNNLRGNVNLGGALAQLQQHQHQQQQQLQQQHLQMQQQQHQQQQQQQQRSPHQNDPSSYDSTLASSIDQVIRASLNDSPHVHSKATSNHASINQFVNFGENRNSNQAQEINMPSPPSSSSILTNHHQLGHVSVASSAASNLNAQLSLGLMSMVPSLNSMHGTNLSTADTMHNSAVVMSKSGPGGTGGSITVTNANHSGASNNANNLTNRTPAHSASHSVLAAAAALQSLNQSHMQHSPNFNQLQQSLRPPSNHSMPIQSLQQANAMSRMSTTPSEQFNQNHDSLDNTDINSVAAALRFQQKMSFPTSIAIQDQINNNNQNRWPPSSNPYSSGFINPPNYTNPTSSSMNTSAVNSNFMIGRDNDGMPGNSFTHQGAHSSNRPPNLLSSIPMNIEDKLMGLVNASRQNSQNSFENQRKINQPTNRIAEELDKNAMRLDIFIHNLKQPIIPGTNRPKRIVPIDSVDELRQSICNGDFYSKYEEIAVGILTNQVLVPEFFIIDYIKRDKFTHQESEKIQQIHKRLGLTEIFCLLEVAGHRVFIPSSKSNIIKPTSVDSAQQLGLATGNLQTTNNSQLQSLRMSQFTPSSPEVNTNLPNIDKCRRSTQSPSDIMPRSQFNNSGPRIMNPVITRSHITLPLPLASSRSATSMTAKNNQYAGLTSPFHQGGPTGAHPLSRSNSALGDGFPNDTATMKQPPAAHLNSISKLGIGPDGSQPSSQTSVPSGGVPPVSAHMSSITPQTPRVFLHDTFAPMSKTSPDKLTFNVGANDRQGKNTAGIGAAPKPGNSAYARSDFMDHQSMDLNDDIRWRTGRQDIFPIEPNLRGPPNIRINNSMGDLVPPNDIAIMNEFNMRSKAQPNMQLNNPLSATGPIKNGPIGKQQASASMPSIANAWKGNPSVDMNRFDESKDSLNMNASNNQTDPQLNQYSALVSAYQQQQALMMSNRATNLPNSYSAPGPLGAPQFAINLHPSNSSSSLSTIEMNLGESMSQQANMMPSISTSSKPPLSQQTSPRSSNQRSIVSGTVAGPKKSKKAKTSPNNPQSGENYPLDQSFSNADKSHARSVNKVENLSQNTDKELLGPQEIQSELSQTNQPVDLHGSSSVDLKRPIGNATGMSALNAVITEPSTTSISNKPVAATPSDSDNAAPEFSTNLHGATLPSSERFAQAVPERIAVNGSCEDNSNKISFVTSDPLNADIAKSIVAPLQTKSFPDKIDQNSKSEPSKYQKFHTKKAWLKNYDQEDQTRVQAASETTDEWNVGASDNPAKTEVKLEPVADELATVSNEPKNLKSMKSDAKRKTKKGSPNVSTKPARNKNPSETWSDNSSVCTTDFDSDDFNNSRSSAEKQLRRTPRHKVKPSSEDNRNSKKMNKDLVRSSGVKRKLEDDETDPKKMRKIKSGSKIPSKTNQEQKALRRNAARNNSKGDDENRLIGAKKASRAAKSKDSADVKSIGSQSDDETLYSSSDSDAASSPTGEARSSTRKSKRASDEKDPKSDQVRGKGSKSSKKPTNSPCLSPTNDESSSHMIEADEVSDRTKLHDKYKQTGEQFLQTDPCYEIVPKMIRCLECRRVRTKNTKNDKSVATRHVAKTNWDDFCRFYEFRKLQYNKASQIVVAGFSNMDDASDEDKALWLPNTSNPPENLDLKSAEYIIKNIGDQFCNLVKRERDERSSYLTSTGRQQPITWKKAVNGLRELCDVCATTLFNCHYVCERCGYVVCIDCHSKRNQQSRLIENSQSTTQNENDVIASEKSISSANKSSNDTSESSQLEISKSSSVPTKKSKQDQFGWILCTKNEEHACDKLVLAQIIAGDCLERLCERMHRARQKFNLGSCSCEAEGSLNGASPLNGECDTKSEGSHQTLKDLLMASNSGQDEQNAIEFIPKDETERFGNGVDEKPFEMFEDFPREEDDLQEEARLAQQVTDAIEGCISSLQSSGDEGPPPSKANDSSESIVPGLGSQVKEVEKKHFDATLTDTESHSWLCGGELLVLSHHDSKKNLGIFRAHWRRGRPVLVRGVDQSMKIQMWLPSYFGMEFGDYRSDLVDCRNGDIHKQSMKKYWEGFEPTSSQPVKKKLKDDSTIPPTSSAPNEELTNAPSYYNGTALWRLKDWPPGQDFNEILPTHYNDFMNNLPIPSYTTRGGKLNLACRLPVEMLKPDLGPKMYSAYGTTMFPERGTTNLHLDISDAINVMIYVNGANAVKSGSVKYRDVFGKTIDESHIEEDMKKNIESQKLFPGALWHIFRPIDAQKLRDFLNIVSDERNICPTKRSDPIHDQTWYLDQSLLDRLYKDYNIRPYPVLQCMGDAIVIPAGAPHQVKNLHNCIKVANDFVSPENVEQCLKLTDEFRNLPETHINQEDKLQIKNILYHSIKESLQFMELIESEKVDPKGSRRGSSDFESCEQVDDSANIR